MAHLRAWLQNKLQWHDLPIIFHENQFREHAMSDLLLETSLITYDLRDST
jgi:hypothetical protein